MAHLRGKKWYGSQIWSLDLLLNQHVKLPKCRQNMVTSIVDLDLVSKKFVQKSRCLQGVGHTVMGGEAALGTLNALMGLWCP